MIHVSERWAWRVLPPWETCPACGGRVAQQVASVTSRTARECLSCGELVLAGDGTDTKREAPPRDGGPGE